MSTDTDKHAIGVCAATPKREEKETDKRSYTLSNKMSQWIEIKTYILPHSPGYLWDDLR